jgi:ribosomal protein S18 acetylase RimI-like enzyme
MVAYRFCRPDDIPLLVRAVNECYDVHFPDLPPMDLETFQTEVRELDLWPSNCMVASASSAPVGVCIAAKRNEEVLVSRVGIRPDSVREGHGGHMLTSLSHKLAVLGPPRLVMELPEDCRAIHGLLESVGYVREAELVDFVEGDPLPPLDFADAVIPVTVGELGELGLLRDDSNPAWETHSATLIKRGERIRGWAIASPDGIEAWLLYWDQPARGVREILRIEACNPDLEHVLLSLLLRYCRQVSDLPLAIRKLAPEPGRSSLLRSLGFEPRRRFIRYAAVARPG